LTPQAVAFFSKKTQKTTPTHTAIYAGVNVRFKAIAQQKLNKPNGGFSLIPASQEFSISSEQYLKRQQFNAQTNLAIHPALCASNGILYE
jgi:hypothetical protein